LDAPIARLIETRGELAKTWLMRLLDGATLDEIERIPTARIVRDLPELIGEIAHAAAADEPVAPDIGSQHVDWVRRLAELTGREVGVGPALVRDIAALQSVVVTSLHRQLRSLDPVATLEAVERLTDLFSSLQADAIEEVLRQRSRELEWLGTTDGLTGLHTEKFLQQHIHHLLGVQKRYGHPFAVLVLDIDGLKRINDAYGKAAGDRTLVDVATALGESIRDVDTPVRLGEDEFCVLLPNQTATRARILAERIAVAVEAVEGPASGTSLQVSIGVVSSPQHSTDASELLELADAAMYSAKAAGTSVEVGAEPASNGNGNGNGNGG
jgi:diguanylate cyclase (GGDEF)-like protein